MASSTSSSSNSSSSSSSSPQKGQQEQSNFRHPQVMPLLSKPKTGQRSAVQVVMNPVAAATTAPAPVAATRVKTTKPLSVLKPSSGPSPSSSSVQSVPTSAPTTNKKNDTFTTEVKTKNRTPSMDEFMDRFRDSFRHCLDNAYTGDHQVIRAVQDDTITTTLCEDVYSLVHMQFKVLQEYLTHIAKLPATPPNEARDRIVVICLSHMIRELRMQQEDHRDRFLGLTSPSTSTTTSINSDDTTPMDTIEASCAAANDFMRMMECFDDFMETTVQEEYPHLFPLPSFVVSSTSSQDDKNEEEKVHRTTTKPKTTTALLKNPKDMAGLQLLEQQVSDLVALYGNDALYAVQRSQVYVMRSMKSAPTATTRNSISALLFSSDWEETLVQNEVVMSMIHTMEDYLYDYHSYLSNEFLFRHICVALIRTMVCFYIQSLLEKAMRIRGKLRSPTTTNSSNNNNNNSKKHSMFGMLHNPSHFLPSFSSYEQPFHNPHRAALRMMYDIHIFREYFNNLVSEIPALKRCVDEELAVLEIIHECFNQAVMATTTATSTTASTTTTKTALSSQQPRNSSLSSSPYTSTSLDEYIVVLHKRTGANPLVTKYIMKDLWLLTGHDKWHRHLLSEKLIQVEGELQLLSQKIDQGKKESPFPVALTTTSTSTTTTRPNGVTKKKTFKTKPRSQHNDPLSGLRLVTALESLYEQRILQEKHRPCHPCMKMVHKTVHKTKDMAHKTKQKIMTKSPTNYYHGSENHASSSKAVPSRLAADLMTLPAVVERKIQYLSELVPSFSYESSSSSSPFPSFSSSSSTDNNCKNSKSGGGTMDTYQRWKRSFDDNHHFHDNHHHDVEHSLKTIKTKVMKSLKLRNIRFVTHTKVHLDKRLSDL